jgi:hypothetical protein
MFRFLRRFLTLFVFASGSTALHMSARWGHIHICRLLLTSKADVHLKDNRFRLLHLVSWYVEIYFCLPSVNRLHCIAPL